MRAHLLTAPFTKLVKRNAEIAVMNEAKYYDLSTNLWKKNEEVTSPSSLTERSRPSKDLSDPDKKKNCEKKEAS